jgi:hypothetical protein
MHRFMLVFLLFCSLALADGIPDVAEYLSASSALPLLGDTPIEGYFSATQPHKGNGIIEVYDWGVKTKNASRVVGCPTNRTRCHLSTKLHRLSRRVISSNYRAHLKSGGFHADS